MGLTSLVETVLSLPVELRVVSRRCLLLAASVGTALAWMLTSVALEQGAAAGVDRSQALLPVLPFALLVFALGAGATIGGYLAVKLLLHHLGRLRDDV